MFLGKIRHFLTVDLRGSIKGRGIRNWGLGEIEKTGVFHGVKIANHCQSLISGVLLQIPNFLIFYKTINPLINLTRHLPQKATILRSVNKHLRPAGRCFSTISPRWIMNRPDDDGAAAVAFILLDLYPRLLRSFFPWRPIGISLQSLPKKEASYYLFSEVQQGRDNQKLLGKGTCLSKCS